MLRSVELKDYMLTHPVTVRAEATMGEAIRLIIDNKISGLCVVDDSGRLVGILSELDCLRAMLSQLQRRRHRAGQGLYGR